MFKLLSGSILSAPVISAKRSALRLAYRVSFAFLSRIGRIKPCRIPSDNVMSASRLMEENRLRLSALVEGVEVEVLYQENSNFGCTFYVESSSLDRLLDALWELHGENFGVDVTFFMGGGLRKIRVTSRGNQFVVKNFVPAESIDEISIYKVVAGIESKKHYHRAYASRIRFVESENEWWVNRWSDVGSSPVRKSHIEQLGLPSITDITYPIDMVYTWVDGADPEWCARKDAALESLGFEVPRRSANRSRWENRDELRYSLRSVAMFVPWIRNIYILTDRQVPSWLSLSGGGKIRIIDHRDVFPAGAKLPCFNSHAIESVLHRIAGISEHFIYMNDDFFFGAPTNAEDFFTVSGLTKVFYSRSLMPVGEAEDREKASEWGGINASRLLENALGRVIRRKVRHTPVALRKSVLADLEVRFANAFDRVRKAQFRSVDDIAPLTSLYVNYAIATGSAVSTGISYAYIDIGEARLERKLYAYIRSSGRKVFCLNDTDEYEEGMSCEKKNRLVHRFLETLYPWPSPWEVPERKPVPEPASGNEKVTGIPAASFRVDQ